jgi:hypothetical protein
MNKDFWKNFSTFPSLDCLKMKQDIQASIYEEIKHMNPDELVAYFNRAGEDFRRRKTTRRNSDAFVVQEQPAAYKSKKPRKK